MISTPVERSGKYEIREEIFGYSEWKQYNVECSLLYNIYDMETEQRKAKRLSLAEAQRTVKMLEKLDSSRVRNDG